MAADPSADILPPPLPRAGRVLAWTMLTWTLGVVVLVTLAPFRFRIPSHIELEWHAGAYEFAVNCVLLAVPGFLFRAATGPNRDVYCVGPFAFGVAVSAAVELAQGAVPGRCVSPIDVATNAGGCWFGAMVHDSLRRHLDARLAGKLLLELPLMGLVYLLVPLLWFSGEAAAEDGRRLALTIPLGVMGGAILASVWHHRLRPEGVLSRAGIAGVAAAWFVTAAAPALRHRPESLAAGIVIVTTTTWLLAGSRWFLCGDGERFEMPTLRRAGWLYLVYLGVLAGWPWRTPAAEWRGAWELPDLGSPPRIGPLFRLVEDFAAFTFGGYLVAESRGRRDDSTARTVAVTAAALAGFAAVFEGFRGFAPDYGASGARVALGAIGAAAGALVYRRQLDAVRAFLAARPRRESSESAPGAEPTRSRIDLEVGSHRADAPGPEPKVVEGERAPV